MAKTHDKEKAQDAALPLARLNVLELGHIIAGPVAGQILADMGAVVTKIESVGSGDRARNMPGGIAGMFHFLNRNKRSVALDLKGDGRPIFLEMARAADVIIDNFAYGATERLGIGYDVVSKINPGVVWLSIKGFLPGPSESQLMLDELAQMAGGLAFMTGTDEKPTRAGASVIDICAATYGIVAVLAALRQRDSSGRGQRIVAGLYETSVYLVAQWMASAQYSGERSVPTQTQQMGPGMGWGTYQLFDTADAGRVFIGIVSDAQWERFCAQFGFAELFADPRLKQAAGRLAHRPEMNKKLAELLRRHTQAEALVRLKAANVPFALVRRPDELGAEEHLVASGQLVEMPFPNGRVSHLPKLPFRADGFDMNLRNAAPVLGADTFDALVGLGYSESDIEELRARGAVGMPAARKTAQS